MGSILYAVKCPCCERSAIEDYYYKTEEKYTFCLRCGFNYTKIIKSHTDKSIEYTEETNEGHGVFILLKKDGSRESMMLNRSITDQDIEEYESSYMKEEVNQQESYLVSFKEGIFSILLGTPPANFFLPFEEYKTKMFEKYGKAEDEFFVPIEE